MKHNRIIEWLLKGDVSIQYQVYRDLLEMNKPLLQKRMSTEGWGVRLLRAQKPDGNWGNKFYQPKWTCTHYTLLDLKNLGLPQRTQKVNAAIDRILTHEKGSDGGINPSRTVASSDACIAGMALNYCSYFKAEPGQLNSLIDFLLTGVMPDGGFNCRFNRQGAKHSSLHTTLSVLEGINEYLKNGYVYKAREIKKAGLSAIEFVLMHQLFLSDKTGNIIKSDFLKFHYPCRWYYDILRALDYFQYAGINYDNRMDRALDELRKQQSPGDTWKLAAPHKGQTHFTMEKAGEASRWNTLRALRVLKYYQ